MRRDSIDFIKQAVLTSEVLNRFRLELCLSVELRKICSLDTACRWLKRSSPPISFLLDLIVSSEWIACVFFLSKVIEATNFDAFDIGGFHLSEIHQALELSLLTLEALSDTAVATCQ